MRISFLYGLIASLPFAFSSQAQARGFELSGEALLATEYADEDLSVYTKGPTIQASVALSHETGFYGEIWTNTGLKHSSGDEVDYIIGYEHKVARDTTVEASVAYYDFRHGYSAKAGSVGISHKGAKVRVDYIVPTDKYEAKGARVVASFTKEWQNFSLTPSVTHDTGPFNGVPTITVGAVKAEYQATKNISFSLSAQMPIAKKSYDMRKAQVVASITMRF